MQVQQVVSRDLSLDEGVIGALVNLGLLDDAQRTMVESTARELDLPRTTTLLRLGLIGEDNLFTLVSEQLSWPLVDKINLCPPATLIIQAADALGLSIDWCVSQRIFPTQEENGVTLYVENPFSHHYRQMLLLCQQHQHASFSLLTPAMAAAIEDDISRERAVSALFGTLTTDLAALAEEAPVINLVNSIMERAIFADASDIHIEAGAKNMRVRFRVDGKLVEFMQQPTSRFAAIASRIKLLAQLDIAERRLPQDGRFSTRAGKREYDVRVSTAPDVHGESIVMRLLPKKRDELQLASLGFAPDHLALIRQWGAFSNGIILVTGPTGSGNSTTLYGLLADIKTGEEKILTVEDPVEYQLEGITQVQARADIGYTFARALRSFLRQDPDIIMIGEIRDKETADIAIQSSLTGHLVLSTLHTNDACSVFPRLADIGIEPYLTAATIQGVQAQRLVRKLCEHCAEDVPAPDFLTQEARLSALLNTQGHAAWKKPVGCKHCHGRGYRGRIGIYELVPVTADIRSLVAARADVGAIREAARAAGFRSLFEDGMLKAALGHTSVEDVLRVCAGNEDEA